MLRAIEDGMYTPSMKDRMAELERSKAELEETLARSPEPPNVRIHPAMSKVYARKVEELEAALEAPATRTEAMETIRRMIERIVFTPVEEGLRAELRGDFAEIVATCDAARSKKELPGNILPRSQLSLVVGACFPRYLRLSEGWLPAF